MNKGSVKPPVTDCHRSFFRDEIKQRKKSLFKKDVKPQEKQNLLDDDYAVNVEAKPEH